MADRPGGGNTIDDTHDTRAELGNASTVSGKRGGAVSRPPDLEGQMVGEYRVETKVGEGGMGTVYGALHPVIGKRAAIKVIKKEMCTSPELVERFVQEARAVNQIGHPNIVDIFSFGTLDDGRSYFVMEWLRGESLAGRMKRSRLPFGEAIEILEGIIRGLEAAHGSGIVHRDLKPDNVFLVEVRGERPQVKLLDFGIAKLTAGEDNRMERTRSGVLMGTPRYIAPEQARGLAIDFRADVYSLGVLAFEMFTGKPPFDAATAMDLIAKHLNDVPPRASSVAPIPAALDRLIHEMLDKEPANRPDLTRVRGVLDELRTAHVDLALVGTVPDADLPPALRARKQQRRVGVFVLGGVVLAGAGALAVYEMSGGKSAPAPAAAVISVDAAPAPPPTPAPAPALAPARLPSTGHITLHITGGEPTRILLDNAALPSLATSQDFDLAPGTHVFEVDAKGRKPSSQAATITAGDSTDLSIALGAAVVTHTVKKPPHSSGGGSDDTGVFSPFGNGSGSGK